MIRKIETEDKKRLVEIVENIPEFNEREREVAKEMIQTTSPNGENFYDIFVYETGGNVVGFHCVGKRSLTEGSYDLYWIVVHPEHQNRNIGRKLLNHAEEFVRQNDGSWLFVETSSKEELLPTRKFYLRNNYTILAEIRDFYAKGNHMILFGKYLKNKGD